MKNRKCEAAVLIIFCLLVLLFAVNGILTISSSGYRLALQHGTTFERSAQGISMQEEAVQSVDLNTAAEEELEQLDGIGSIRAQAIVSWREKNGSFTNVDELTQVPGFDEELVDTLRELVTLERGEES